MASAATGNSCSTRRISVGETLSTAEVSRAIAVPPRTVRQNSAVWPMSVPGLRLERHRALRHDEAAVGGIPFPEQHVALPQRPVLAGEGDEAQRVIVHEAEQRRAGQHRDVVIERHAA